MQGIKLLLAIAVIGLTACAKDNLSAPAAPLGDFALGHNIVVVKNLQAAPGSREVPAEEWQDATRAAIAKRLERYSGDKLYNIAVSLEAYLLAPKGIPLVAAPKSIIVARVSVWDDAEARLMTKEPVQLVVVEQIEAESILGKGFYLQKDAQMLELADQLALKLENLLRKQHDEAGWFQAAQ